MTRDEFSSSLAVVSNDNDLSSETHSLQRLIFVEPATSYTRQIISMNEDYSHRAWLTIKHFVNFLTIQCARRTDRKQRNIVREASREPDRLIMIKFRNLESRKLKELEASKFRRFYLSKRKMIFW